MAHHASLDGVNQQKYQDPLLHGTDYTDTVVITIYVVVIINPATASSVYRTIVIVPGTTS